MSSASKSKPSPSPISSSAASSSASASGRANVTGSGSVGSIEMFRYCLRPVAAGMSLPMITFSLSPLSRSTLPSIAASVSTFVVSWNEAAERNDSVASDAFVMPRMIGSKVACSPFSFFDAGVLALEDDPVDELAGQELRVAVRLDAHLLQHLADDELDVLVVDLDALRLVDLLHLAHEVQLRRRRVPEQRAARPG